jgi:hypothetical protein
MAGLPVASEIGRPQSTEPRRCKRQGSERKGHKAQHRGVITRTAESVFGALIYLTEKYGRVFPSLEGLAYAQSAMS